MKVIQCEHKGGTTSIPESEIKEIVSELTAGRLIVYPTDTVYGLGCDPFDETAVKRAYMVKRRPFDMPMSIVVKDLRMMEELALLDDSARILVEKFMPGPLTLIVTKKPAVPDILTASSTEIGVRIPDHPVALRIIEEFGPIITTSANVHSHKSPRTCQDAIEDLGPTVSIYIDAGPAPIGRPSTIVQISEGEISLIRQGDITEEEIRAVLDER